MIISMIADGVEQECDRTNPNDSKISRLEYLPMIDIFNSLKDYKQSVSNHK